MGYRVVVRSVDRSGNSKNITIEKLENYVT